MPNSLFTEAQNIEILKQTEAGRTVTDLCREHRLTQAPNPSERDLATHGNGPTLSIGSLWSGPSNARRH